MTAAVVPSPNLLPHPHHLITTASHTCHRRTCARREQRTIRADSQTDTHTRDDANGGAISRNSSSSNRCPMTSKKVDALNARSFTLTTLFFQSNTQISPLSPLHHLHIATRRFLFWDSCTHQDTINLSAISMPALLLTHTHIDSRTLKGAASFLGNTRAHTHTWPLSLSLSLNPLTHGRQPKKERRRTFSNLN